MFTQSFTYPIDIGSNPFLFEDAQDNPGTMSIDPTISKRGGCADAATRPTPSSRRAVSAATAVSGGVRRERPDLDLEILAHFNFRDREEGRNGAGGRAYRWTGSEEVAEVRGGGAARVDGDGDATGPRHDGHGDAGPGASWRRPTGGGGAAGGRRRQVFAVGPSG